MKTFDEFYKKFGLKSYPFTIFTTELEEEKAKDLFIPSTEHGPMLESFVSNRSMVIIGERGVGKTAVKEEFVRHIKDRVSAVITNYEELDIAPDEKQIYLLIVKNLIIELVNYIAKKPISTFKMSKQDKVYLSFMVYYFSTKESLELIKENVGRIQNNIALRLMCRIYNNTRSVLNYSGTVLENALKRYIAQNMGVITFYDEKSITEFFPELKLKTYMDFESREVTFKELERLCDLIIKVTGSKPVVVFDKMDEDNRIKNDADLIADFLDKFLSDTKFLSLSKIQLVHFAWSTPYRFIKDTVRSQKFYTPTIHWDLEHLLKVLNRRLEVFSEGTLNNILTITDFTSNAEICKYLEITNGVPRDLWHFMNKLFEEQYAIDAELNKLTKEAFERATERLVSETNYYEYYPRKSNSRADSMDIYSYFGYLYKLKKEEFTKNEFREDAGAGGSTNNYLIGMEKIGLIEQRNMGQGVIRYRIKDNKIIFAVKNQIDIRQKKLK